MRWTPGRRQPSDEPHPVFPAVGVVEGGVEQAVPDPGSADVGTHPWQVGLRSGQLPTARSEKRDTFQSVF